MRTHRDWPTSKEVPERALFLHVLCDILDAVHPLRASLPRRERNIQVDGMLDLHQEHGLLLRARALRMTLCRDTNAHLALLILASFCIRVDDFLEEAKFEYVGLS